MLSKKKFEEIFSTVEIKESQTLQHTFFALIFYFYVAFFNWLEKDIISISSLKLGSYTCPPYFLDCGNYYFLQALPYGYSQGFFYMCLFAVLGLGIYFALKKEWLFAQLTLFTCLAWMMLVSFVLTYGISGNFNYYAMVLAFVFIFLPKKKYFLKLSFVFLYFLASTIKLDEGWIFGNYLRNLISGAPFFSNTVLPLATNLVILMQILGTWFLLSNNKYLQKIAFIYFLIFHFYSGIIVNYTYVSISIPILLILFSKYEEFRILKINRTTLYGYLFLFFLLASQLIGIVIPGDQKITMEGNFYGLYMFEANHQCIANVRYFLTDGKILESKKENHIANNRCDVYRYFFNLKNKCKKQNVDKISWQFDHSINGNPYERIVDTENVCELDYKVFSHNDWIKIENESTRLDLPVYKNGFSREIDDAIKIPADPIVNDKVLGDLRFIYWCLWISVLISVITFLFFISFLRK